MTDETPNLDMVNSALDRMAALDVELDRDSFMREVLGELAAALQEVVGLREVEGFVSVVGDVVGTRLSKAYSAALGDTSQNTSTLAAVLVDLKRRIGGGFSVESISPDQIVFVNSACPFGDRVAARPSLCMMTSNVFGRIAADASGYARVKIDEAIANGSDRCRIVVALASAELTDDEREYFRRDRE